MPLSANFRRQNHLPNLSKSFSSKRPFLYLQREENGDAGNYQAAGEPAKRIEIDNTLEALQKAVGGYIETVSIFTDVTLICNEEGRLTGLPYNMDFAGIRFVGPVLVVGRSEDDFRSLTDEEFTAIMRWIFKQAGESK